jgi:predicted nucleic acid-binding protein
VTILDAGPLAAFLNARDAHHAWARARLAEVPAPVLTCEAAITEVCFLARRNGGDPAVVINLLVSGLLRIAFRLDDEIDSIRTLMKSYADQGISLADACLVRMSELHPRSRVMTLDRGFLVYKREGRKAIPLIAPFV